MKKESTSSFYMTNRKKSSSSSDETDVGDERKVILSSFKQFHKRKSLHDNSSTSSSSEDEHKEIDKMNFTSLQVKGKKAKRPFIKKEIKRSSSSSESDAEEKIVQSYPFHIKRSLEETSSSSENENQDVDQLNLAPGKIEEIERNIPNKVHKKTLKHSMREDDNIIKSEIKNSLKNEKMMLKNIERRPIIKSEVNSSSDSDSDTSTKSKVKILQDVHLNPVLKSPKERLEKKYPGIKELKTAIDINFSESEDVYLFRIPKNVDPNLLKDVIFDLDEEFRLNIGEKYNIKWTEKIPDPTLVVSDDCRVVNFKRNIKMEKYIKSKKEPKIVIPEKKMMPLPDNLKNRHPLFGLDFEQKIVLSENVEKRLDDAIANILRKEKKMKRKKHKKTKFEQDDEKPKEEIFHLLSSHSSKKKIKKETSEDSAFSSSGSMDKISKKNKKKQSIINNTLDDTYKKDKTESELDSHVTKSQKKKKKNREWSMDGMT